jgi:tripartite-type tricarboxylate transporter receptor subunit TctC
MTISRPWPSAAKLLIAALALCASAAFGQAWPAKPIRLVVPWPAGGTVDGVARVIGPMLSAALGQPVIIDNKGGAGGSIGAAEVAKALADGHTLIAVFDTHAVNHLLYKKLAYDPFKSFEHVSLLVTSPQILVAATNFAPNTIAELVDYAKANPGKVTYATVGTGSSNHLNAIFFSSRAGIDMLHIPYKGGAPMMTDMIGGQVNVMFVSAPQALPQIKAGRIKALAVGSTKRMAQLPDTPAVAESLPGFRAQSWVGMLAPADTPKAVIERLHHELVKILADAGVRARLDAQGFEIVGSSPAEFLAFTHSESDKWAKVIRDFDVKVD